MRAAAAALVEDARGGVLAALQNATGQEVAADDEVGLSLAKYAVKRTPAENRAAAGMQVPWQPRPGAVETKERKSFPGQSKCNWPYPDWQTHRKERLQYLYDGTKRQCITLINTGTDSDDAATCTHKPLTWKWAKSYGSAEEVGMFAGREAVAMPDHLIRLLREIPENAFVTYELTPWANAQAGGSGSTDAVFPLNYCPPSNENGSAPAYGQFCRRGWMAPMDEVYFRRNGSTKFGRQAQESESDYPWNDDHVERSVGKFVSGGQLIWMCTDAEQWEQKKEGKMDKSFDPKWQYLRDAYKQDIAIEEGAGVVSAMKKTSNVGGYKPDFAPVAGFMMLRYSDTPTLMASRARGGDGQYIHRTHQPTFHPKAWSANLEGGYGPAVARLWWQPAGRTSRPKGWRTYGDPALADSNLEYSRELNAIIDDNYDYQDGAWVAKPGRAQGELLTRQSNPDEASRESVLGPGTLSSDMSSETRAGEISDNGREIFFGGRYNRAQDILQQLPAGSRLFGGGNANGFWKIVRGGSLSQVVSSGTGAQAIAAAGNVLQWTPFS